MHCFLQSYVIIWAFALPLAVIILVTTGARNSGVGRLGSFLLSGLAAVYFASWGTAAYFLSQAGYFAVPATILDPPYVLMLLLGGSGLTWLLAVRLPIVRRAVLAAPLCGIADLQSLRIMGAVFLVLWLVGAMPWEFAIVAGLGDLWAAISGISASRALASGDSDARGKLKRANAIGMLDFVVAVVLGILTSQGFAHLLARDAPNIINDHPLALFPFYFVPIFLALHLIAITRLRSDGLQDNGS